VLAVAMAVRLCYYFLGDGFLSRRNFGEILMMSSIAPGSCFCKAAVLVASFIFIRQIFPQF